MPSPTSPLTQSTGLAHTTHLLSQTDRHSFQLSSFIPFSSLLRSQLLTSTFLNPLFTVFCSSHPHTPPSCFVFSTQEIFQQQQQHSFFPAQHSPAHQSKQQGAEPRKKGRKKTRVLEFLEEGILWSGSVLCVLCVCVCLCSDTDSTVRFSLRSIVVGRRPGE